MPVVLGPILDVTAFDATSITWTVKATSGNPGATLSVGYRPAGSNAVFIFQAFGAPPQVGDVVTISGLTTGVILEWRSHEITGSFPTTITFEGNAGLVTPSASIWATLTGTIQAVLLGAAWASDDIFIGRHPPTDQYTLAAIIRTGERSFGPATQQSERVVYSVDVEMRFRQKDPAGTDGKTWAEGVQESLKLAFHEKHAGDFPSIPGLEAIRYELADLDNRAHRGQEDEYLEEIRSIAVVHFAIWQDK